MPRLFRFALIVGGALSLLGLSQAGEDQPEKEKTGWSRIISAATLEAEILAHQAELKKATATQQAFQAGGHLQARNSFNALAMLLAIVADYEDEVRFRQSAEIAMPRFRQAALNCKVATQASYREAKERLADLAAITAGEKLAGEAGKIDWTALADRAPLMRQLEKSHTIIFKDRLKDEQRFAEGRQSIRQQAELIAAVGAILRGTGMPDVGEADYVGYAAALSGFAERLASDAERGNYQQAKKSLGQVQQECSNCHENFRAE